MTSKNWLVHTPIAHRGLWTEGVPENSFAAFECAIRAGHPIELDVQMLSDGTMIVFHDWTLDRMTSASGAVAHASVADIVSVRLQNTQQKIPFLTDVLAFVDGRVPLLIEMKYRGRDRERYITQVFSALEGYHGVYAVSSFHPFLVKAVKKRYPKVICGQNFSDYPHSGSVCGWIKKMSMYILWWSSRHVPDFFVCRATLLPDCWIRTCAVKNTKPLLVWALRSDVDYRQKRGIFDNYIFDHKPYEQKSDTL